MSTAATTQDEQPPDADRPLALDAIGVTKQFGGLTAVNDVSFQVPERSIVSIIGPNGAGKTTFFNMLTGFYKPTLGKISLHDRNITGNRPDVIMKLGMARTFQNIRLFGTMSALENVMVGQNSRMKAGLFGSIFRFPVLKEERLVHEKAHEELDYVGVKARHHDWLAINLSYGDQRRVEIARALASDPKILLLDEPTAGMNPQESAELTDVHAQAARRARHHRGADRARHEGDHGGLRVHHRARPRREDRRGRTQGSAEGPAGHRGLPRQEGVRGTQREGRRVAMSFLEVDDIKTYYGNIQALKGVTLEVNEGECVTLIGSNGAGKSTTLRSISGLTPPREGSIRLAGDSIEHLPPQEIVRLGVCQSPEGRKCFQRMTVRENLELGAFLRRDNDGIASDLKRVFALFPRLDERQVQKAGTMSGGEQQMLAIGRALMGNPQILLLDEPSMGISPILTERIYETIAEINKQGMTILLVEQNANFALEVSQRAYVLETGKVVMSDESASLRSNPEVQKAYLGT